MSEIDNNKKSKIFPVFVNIGHALANTEELEPKRKLLKALIRATYLNEEFKNDEDLKLIYNKSLGHYKKVERGEKGIAEQSSFNTELMIQVMSLICVLLVVLGVVVDNIWARIVLAFIGTAGLSCSFGWKKEWMEKIFKSNETVIDDSIEYLEIKFENWLKEKSGSYKIIFVIDELDKLNPQKSFKTIKEFKNLFTCSLAHFIFISDQRAFDLTEENREGNENGIFPTLFTHVFYLPLPNSSELKSYLDEIMKEEELQSNLDAIKSYLLFKSKNDFFELKKVLLDHLQYNEKGPYLEVEKIKEEDKDFDEIVSLYSFVDSSMQKFLKSLKKYWKDNSLLQKDFFNFINNNLNKTIIDKDEFNKNEQLLIIVLLRGKIIKERGKDENNFNIYDWTHNYQIKNIDELFPEEEEFLSYFSDIIKIANDIKQLPEKYVNGDFIEKDVVMENDEEVGLIGINLFSLYTKYKNLNSEIKNKKGLLNIKLEEIEKGGLEMSQSLENIETRYFDIFRNLLNKILEKNTNIFKGENLAVNNYDIHNIINQFPNFMGNFSIISNYVYGKSDKTKYVFIIKEFDSFENIQDGLRVLNNNKNVLFINLFHGKMKNQKCAKFEEEIIQKRKKNKKRKVPVNNFINYNFCDFRDLSELLKIIENFLI